MEKFNDAVANLCSVLTDENERVRYQDHLVVWVEHCEDIKDRAREVIEVLEAAHSNTSAQFTQSAGIPIYDPHAGPSSSSGLVTTAFSTGPIVPMPGSTSSSTITVTALPYALPSTCLPRTLPVSFAGSTASGIPATHAPVPRSGFVTGTEQLYSSTNLEIAMNSIDNAINDDLAIIEQEFRMNILSLRMPQF